jgi:hypothetical protein
LLTTIPAGFLTVSLKITFDDVDDALAMMVIATVGFKWIATDTDRLDHLLVSAGLISVCYTIVLSYKKVPVI